MRVSTYTGRQAGERERERKRTAVVVVLVVVVVVVILRTGAVTGASYCNKQVMVISTNMVIIIGKSW